MELCAVTAFLLAAPPALLTDERQAALHGPAVVRFATAAEGAAALRRPDRFIASLSRFDRQSRLRTNADVAEQELLDFIAKQAIEWSPQQIEKLTSITASLRNRFSRFQLPLPATVLLVRTTGKEEGGAAYCRGNAVVLPKTLAEAPAEQLERLLIHELFHIVSSHNPDLRRRLYKIIGFSTCPQIKLPPALSDRKMTNPDAPIVDCFIELETDGISRRAAPVLFASPEEYDPQRGGSFFRYLTFRLMLVEERGGVWSPILEDGQPCLLDPHKTPSFLDQIGDNTRYIIHPDEILADNFVHLVLETRAVATPRVIDAMREQLSHREQERQEDDAP